MSDQTVNLLLVEDDPSLQEGVKDLLEYAELGFPINVITADDGVMGLELMEQTRPDLIISDIMMPNMGGYEFIERVRENSDWVQVPVIFVTAKGSQQDIIRGRLTGAEVYITKPFDSTQLVDLVKIQINRTRQKETVQRQEMDVLKKDILKVLTHEFRTPLTFVTAYYDLLASTASIDDMDNMSDYLRGIRLGCERMGDLAHDLLDVMDIQSGELIRAYRQESKLITDFGKVVQQEVDRWRDFAKNNHVNLVLNPLPDWITPFNGLEKMLSKAIGHLIENGVKFSKYHTHFDKALDVVVDVKMVDQQIIVSVSDYGIGMPESAHRKIFDLFVQHDRVKWEQQGAGVGLTIVKGIVEAHYGIVESRSVSGEGSEFQIILPLTQNERQRMATGRLVMPEENETVRVLLVEDNESVRTSLVDFLRFYDGGYDLETITAVDGVDGLEKLKLNPPDLVITDLMMPRMDGYELIEQIRQRPEWVQIPIIVLSAKSNPSDIMRGRALGAEEFVPKPFDYDDLSSMITAVLNRHYQLKQVQGNSFEHFKLSILKMFQADLLDPLTDVQVLTNDLNQAEDASGLRAMLAQLASGSRQVHGLVDDFIALTEYKTGETETAYEMRSHAHIDLQDLLLMRYQGNLERLQTMCPSVMFEFDGLPPTRDLRVDAETYLKAFDNLTIVAGQISRQAEGRRVRIETKSRAAHYLVEFHLDRVDLEHELFDQIQHIIENSDSDRVGRFEYGPKIEVARGIISIHDGYLTLIRHPGTTTFTMAVPYS